MSEIDSNYYLLDESVPHFSVSFAIRQGNTFAERLAVDSGIYSELTRSRRYAAICWSQLMRILSQRLVAIRLCTSFICFDEWKIVNLMAA